MFQIGVLSGSSINAIDPTQERDPPPQATPVTFPEYELYNRADWNNNAPRNFQALFSQIMKPADIQQQHGEALNIEFLASCSVEDMLPKAADGVSYMPPMPQSEANKVASYADVIKSDAIVAKRREELDIRLTELSIENDVAFRTLTRTLPHGTKGPKLAYMRKFWEALEGMSRYWDSKPDQYYEKADADEDDQKSAKRQRIELQSNGTRGDQTVHSCSPKLLPKTDKGSDAKDVGSSTDQNQIIRSGSATPEARSRMKYKGRRSSTGREMPDQFRADTVKAFVEGVVWPFQCSLAPPRQPPIVQFNKLKLPVRQTAAVYQLPKERKRVRHGRLEGPLIGVQVRSETDFEDGTGETLAAKARLDLMRELGGLLQLAQERRREGKAEVKPGEGEWWTTKPRWGGGPGGSIDECNGGNSDIVQMAEELLDATREGNGKKAWHRSNRGQRRKTPAMLWRELKCRSGSWDAKTDYQAIGKSKSSAYDEVFLVSSLNHHICILKLKAHEAYTDYMTYGNLPTPPPLDPHWCRPKLQRSKWYDLLDVDERPEAFRAVWAVMAFLTRDLLVKEDNGDALMSGTDDSQR